ncbi:MAG TPA: hypothetical protein VHS33_13870 [Sphingomicrobium sp.]|jgi:hypothetical protein|nr:hypothetical protein [Sphingomicrobium sp.]
MLAGQLAGLAAVPRALRFEVLAVKGRVLMFETLQRAFEISGSKEVLRDLLG